VDLAADYADQEHLTLIPAVPDDCGPQVLLDQDDLLLPDFLEMAAKLGGGVLYLHSKTFEPGGTEGSGDDEPDVVPPHLTRHVGQIGEVTVAFAANGVVHFWEHRASWYEGEGYRAEDHREQSDGRDQDDELSEEDRQRLAAELADTILANPAFRDAKPVDRGRIAELAVPPGTNRRVGWDAMRRARDQAEEICRAQYDQITARFDDLAAELLASEAYREAASSGARKQAAERFLIPNADGWMPPAVIRDELYARAQRLAKTRRGSPSELF